MPRRRELRRWRLHRTSFFDLDGDVYFVTDRDVDGLEAVKLDDADAELVRKMRDGNEIEMESAVLAKRHG